MNKKSKICSSKYYKLKYFSLISTAVMLTVSLVKFLYVSGFVSCVCSYKILCAYTTASPSHYLTARPLLTGLAEKGHNVTVITPYEMDSPMQNFNQIIIEIGEPTLKLLNYVVQKPLSMFDMYRMLNKYTKAVDLDHKNLLNNLEVKKLIDEEAFDVLILEATFGNSLLGLAAHFKCPVILFSSLKSQYGIHEITGNPLALSYVSNYFHGFSEPLNFKHRVLNMFWYFIDKFYGENEYYRSAKAFHDQHFPAPEYPSYDDMLKNVSLIFVCHHFSQGSIRPYVPRVVEVGGIHIKEKPLPLPNDLQKWMEESTNGVVYFSLGSIIKSSNLPETVLQKLLNVFGSLKLNVLWKFEDEPTVAFPKNIKLVKWLPQDGILQHKNMKLFITHGGLGSVMEAKYHGVPLIVTPFFADQMSNGFTVAQQGWGIILAFNEITEVTLEKAIQEILTNPKYEQMAKYESLLYRDRPMTAIRTGIYWVEYIIRHNGAKHLQSNAIHLSFFQLHSLDVITLFIFIILAFVFAVYKTVSLLLVLLGLKYSRKIKMC